MPMERGGYTDEQRLEKEAAAGFFTSIVRLKQKHRLGALRECAVIAGEPGATVAQIAERIDGLMVKEEQRG